jgi:hypothetical protein
MAQFGVGDTVQNIFLAGGGRTNSSKTGFVFAGRKLSDTYQIQMPLAGSPLPSPYVPFNLGAFTDGASALAALRKLGFTWVGGYSSTIPLAAPDVVTQDNVTGLVNLVWNSTTTGLEKIVAGNPTGSVAQAITLAAGTVKTIKIGETTTTVVVTMVDGSAAFNTTNLITVSAVFPTTAPDPKLSDEVCCVLVLSRIRGFSTIH